MSIGQFPYIDQSYFCTSSYNVVRPAPSDTPYSKIFYAYEQSRCPGSDRYFSLYTKSRIHLEKQNVAHFKIIDTLSAPVHVYKGYICDLPHEQLEIQHEERGAQLLFLQLSLEDADNLYLVLYVLDFWMELLKSRIVRQEKYEPKNRMVTITQLCTAIAAYCVFAWFL